MEQKATGLKVRLTLLNFLEFAVWGAYLTSMGTYLASVGLASNIGWFYSVQGVVSIFMPALMGIVADRWIEGQRVFSLCHLLAGIFMIGASVYAYGAGDQVSFAPLFTLYTLSVAFFMPTISLNYSVAYSALEGAGLDSVKAFPPIRVWGTVGFIVMMWVVDLCGLQPTPGQWAVSGGLSLVLAVYALTMPRMRIEKGAAKKTLAEALGLNAFKLFANPRMAMFFIFSMLLGVCLQITNSYANPFITSFGGMTEYAGTFGVEHANILISLSQISETLCILLIPFFLSRLGIKKVVLIALLAWVLRFALFGAGNPGGGVWLFVLSMIVYGVAFDFFNISGSLFVNQETDESMRSSAQGLFMMMTNGLGAFIGTIVAMQIINFYVYDPQAAGASPEAVMQGWQTCWYIFAAYALVVAVLFAVFFKYKHEPEKLGPITH
ncbi:MAG: MFS transporter [Bacteroidaceae bacterium]|nr:MFS transporter [Bacteroidaceae bacterium]